MKKVISASRRTDLVAHFPDWLSSVLKEEKALVYGPRRASYLVDLNPQTVHTVVLWSKNFSKLIDNSCGLLDVLKKYDQLYFHFTITGLGGSPLEHGVPSSSVALDQIDDLIRIAGTPERISLRFDPVVYWKDNGTTQTNISFFEKLASELYRSGIKNVRFSMAQWYSKAKRRAAKRGFSYIDPSEAKKKEDASSLARVAEKWNLTLYSCSQRFLTEVSGIRPSACIDGKLLQTLHPFHALSSIEKDQSQRLECGCTESVDIGSYAQSCPHSCVYCYANPQI